MPVPFDSSEMTLRWIGVLGGVEVADEVDQAVLVPVGDLDALLTPLVGAG